jgi:NitT/TauT family transport system ATP-binding protein
MSPRPGRIDQIIPIDLPRPRDIAMMSTPAFGHYTDLIRGRIVSTRKAA